jgi:threonine dehydrogenase-like Zn-dependent dehydrogenase
VIRQLTFAGAGKVEWRESIAPTIDSTDAAIIRPIVLGRCDLDVAFVQGAFPIAPGEPIGHEMIGEVVDIGDGVTSVVPGQRVIVSAQISCGACRNCRRGFTGRCQSVPFGAAFGMGRPGDYGCAAADLMRVPYADAMLVPLPPGADPIAMIGAADMAADAWRAVAPQLAERPGASVLVMGGSASVIGIYAAGLAVVLGAGRVDYADDDSARLAAAKNYGAITIRLPNEIADQYEIVVDARGTPETLIQAIRATEPEGLITSVTIHLGAATPVPMMAMYHKGIFLRTGRANQRTNIPQLLDCCAQGFAPDRVATTLYDFDDAPAAWMDDALRTAAARD